MKIVSGGQTGADRAALDAAMEAGIPAGGWCPQGRVAEDGVIPMHYELKELPGAGYRQRSLQNVLDSDATAIICAGNPTGGTLLTLKCCKNEKKPYILIDTKTRDISAASDELLKFIRKEGVVVLNVAGTRASNDKIVYHYVRRVIQGVLEQQLKNGDI